MSDRLNLASSIAAGSGLEKTKFQTHSFTLAGWQKISAPDKIVNIYIEGDGFAWRTRSTPSSDPTPTNPIALTLAVQDGSDNVVYIARPCQYTATDNAPDKLCANNAYWTDKRYSAEIIDSYMEALDEIMRRAKATEIHITGYSGGANIAGLLAAKRSDIKAITTVAGNVDNDYFIQLHDLSPMPDSLNMANYAAQLASVPQIHFIGADDKVVKQSVFESYAAKEGETSCTQHMVIPNVSHEEGWDKIWPSLVNKPIVCK